MAPAGRRNYSPSFPSPVLSPRRVPPDMRLVPRSCRGTWLLIAAAVACLIPGLLPAQARTSARVAIPRLTGPIDLDGLSNEAAWQAVPPLPAGQSTPTYGLPPSERTEFRLGHDDRYLYASGRLYDSSPDGIRATSLRRDDGAESNDWFVVNLDTYNDKETMVAFATTPAGIRTDLVWPNDGQNSPGPNFSLNSVWDVAVKRTADGWFAEMRIPLSSLRFVERDGQVVMGVNVWRNIARKNEIISSPAVEDRWGKWGVFKASLAQEMTMEGVHRRRPVYLTPYLLGGDGLSSSQATKASPWVRKGEAPREFGADMKVGLTSDLTLDLTYNTDFAQVEADDQQVNLTRFSLFFPEKRPFFQERSGLFEFALGPSEQLFYSRRIGLRDGGPVPMYGGARLVGRLAGWDVGMLNMQSQGVAARGLPTMNFGVFRAKRQVLNPNSFVGMLLTTRFDSGSKNVTAAVDALLRLRARDYLTLQAGHVADSDTTTALACDRSVDRLCSRALDRAMLRVFYERRGLDGLNFGVGVSRFGGRFNPELGYLQRTNFERAGGRLAYGWHQPDASRVQRYTLSVDGFGLQRNSDGKVESASVTPAWTTEMKSGRSFTLSAPYAHEDLRSAFTVATGATIPIGTYRYQRVMATYTPPSANLRRVGVSASVGKFYDGTDKNISLTPTWVVSRNVELSGLYSVDRIDFASRNQHVTAQVARVRARTAFSASVSFAAFVQYNSLSRQVSSNARLRFNPREGTDLYVVYNDARNTTPGDFTPAKFPLDSRTLLVKFSRMIQAEF